MYKILIVEDQAVIRQGIRLILEQDREIEVVGCAHNGHEAFEFCQNNHLDLVLMDVKMPVCDGIEGTRLVKNLGKSVKVLILTSYYHEDELVMGALKNGADGYVLKGVEPQELIAAVKATLNGINPLHQEAFDVVLKRIQSCDTANITQAAVCGQELSSNEISVLKLVVEGKTNKEIASDVYLDEGTVRNIITDLLSIYKLSNRTQLAVLAIKSGLV